MDVIKKSGDIARVNQLRQDRWIVNDLRMGATVQASRDEVLKAVDRIMDVYLMEVEEMNPENNSDSPMAEYSTASDSNSSVSPPTDLISTPEPANSPLDSPPKSDNRTIDSESPGNENEESEDEFFDCLDEIPYDPIASEFFE